MSEDLLSMGSLLECVICLGQFTEPRTLPCLHTYCAACLEDHMNSSATRQQFHCPTCRKTCTVPAGGVRDFPQNFFVNTMISSIAEKAKKQKKAKPKSRKHNSPQAAAGISVCANSEGTDVHQFPVKFCSECQEYLCQECCQGHRRYKATRQHILSSIPNESSGTNEEDDDDGHERAVPDGPQCQVHVEEFTLFCMECRKAICFQCFDREHLNHQCKELCEAAAVMRTRLRKMEKFLKAQSTHFQKTLQKIEENRVGYIADVASVREELDSSLEEVFRLLERKRTALKQALDETVSEAFSTMQSSEEELKLARTTAESLRAHVEDINGASLDDVTILERGPAILCLKDDFQGVATKAINYRFLVEKQSFNTSGLDRLIGSISSERRTQSAIGAVANPVGAAPEAARVERPPDRLQLLDTINVSAAVAGVSALHGRVYIVQKGHPNVLTIYNTSERTSQQLSFQKHRSKSPGTLTITTDGTSMLITENQPIPDYMVTRALFTTLNSDGDLCDQTPVTIPGRVTGVSPNAHSMFLVTTVHPKQLSIYSCNILGNTKISCEETVLLPEDRFTNDIKGIQRDESFAVLDSQKRKITWVNKAGVLLRQYILNRAASPPPSQFRPPCDISHYDGEHFLVTDSRACTVTMVKNDGSSVLDVLDRNDGLFHPHLTYWDSQRGELYVSQLDVQMRPTIRYKGTTRTPGALINVYSLPTRRSQQEAESTPGDLQSENVARLTLPSLVDVDTSTVP